MEDIWQSMEDLFVFDSGPTLWYEFGSFMYWQIADDMTAIAKLDIFFKIFDLHYMDHHDYEEYECLAYRYTTDQ